MSEHTPGPWKVYISGDARPHEIGAPGWRICDVQHYGYSARNAFAAAAIQTANARLIAAAPELLEACRSAERALEDAWQNHVGGSEDLELVRAAIKKATAP